MGTQELAPAELGASAGRRHAGLTEDLGDRRCGDAYTDTSELTDDPLVTPARALTCDAQHQLTDLFRDCGSTRSPPRIRPPSSHKLEMPAQQGVRANEERPARSAQELAGRSKEDAVTLIQPRTSDLAAKHSQFVAEHHNLELLELPRPRTQRRHRKPTPKQQVQQRQHQGAASLHSVRGGRLYGRDSTPEALRTTRWIYVPDRLEAQQPSGVPPFNRRRDH